VPTPVVLLATTPVSDTRLVIDVDAPPGFPNPNIAFLTGITEGVVMLLLEALGLLVPAPLVAVTVNV